MEFKAYMIELISEPYWWDGEGVESYDFVQDHNKGIKFVTKEDAEAVRIGALGWLRDKTLVTEHIWTD